MYNKIYEKFKNFIKVNKFLILIIIVILLLFYIKLPYVIYTPGGTINVANRVIVDGKKETTKGKLQLSYVSMISGSPAFVLSSFIIPNWDLEKVSNIKYENETIDDMMKRDRLYLKQSEDNAIIAAFNKANKKIKINSFHHKIIYISKDSDTNLKIGDEIKNINGKTINTLDDLKKIIDKSKINTKLNITVIRNKKEVKTYAKILKINKEKAIGIAFLTIYDYKTNPVIKIDDKKNESGASGGLMLSLSIYNKITDEDIIKGRNIVGTGTIDAKGNVGEIDGVKYKIMGANKDKADIFLVPEKNYKEAKKTINKNHYKMKLVKVKKIDDAINYLTK